MAAKGPVVVLGAGSAGEHFVGALRRLDSDVEITVVEHQLAGGECSYYACIPTKTLLRPTEALAAARLAPGAAEAVTGDLDAERVWWWRDEVTDGRDDSWHAGWLSDQEAKLVRGEARVLEAGCRRGRRAQARVWRAGGGDGIVARGAADRRARRGRVLDEPRSGLGRRGPGEARRLRRRSGRGRARAVLPPNGLEGDDRRVARSAARTDRPGGGSSAPGAVRGRGHRSPGRGQSGAGGVGGRGFAGPPHVGRDPRRDAPSRRDRPSPERRGHRTGGAQPRDR